VNAEGFEWDAAKAETNLAKHGVSFQAATAVFDDVFAYDRSDSAQESGELGYLITGFTPSVVVEFDSDNLREKSDES
jgi:hypothetical protein